MLHFWRKCRHKCLIYCVTCKICSKFYIGSTQNNVKTRIGLHNQEVRRLANCKIRSDSYASHFASHTTPGSTTVKNVRDIIEVSILWEGNPISVSKSFGKENCSICMKERILILQANQKNKNLVINTNNEMYGGCRHRPRFHRLINKKLHTECTDEAVPAESGNEEAWIEKLTSTRKTEFV